MEIGAHPSSRHAAHDLSRANGFALGPLDVDPPSRRVSAGARSEKLEPRVMRVLVSLGTASGRVLSREDLIELCWDGLIVGDNAINQVISRLRHVLDDLSGGAVRLETITKVGFRLVYELPETESESAATANGVSIVAVLPFTHRGGGESIEILAEDLTEEITRELARSHYFKVIAASTMAAWRGSAIDIQALGRQLEARYLIEGKLQRVAENVRLTVQMIDADTASMVWSPQFICKEVDIATSPEEFQILVASRLSKHIVQIEANRAMTRPGPFSAWEHVLRGVFWLRAASNGMRSAVEESRHAVSAAPDFGMAHAMLANALAGHAKQAGEALGDAQIREIRDHIKRAMQLDGDNPATLSHVSHAYIYLDDVETGLRLASRAAELDPNSSQAQVTLGLAYFWLGRTAVAIATLRNLDRLAPDDSIDRGGLGVLGVCLCLEGRPAEAEEALNRALTFNPDFSFALKWKAIVASQQGKEQAARAAVRQLREAEPGKSIDHHLRTATALPFDHQRGRETATILRRLLEETGGEA